MRVRHPYALTDDGPDPDDTVHYGGRRDVAEVDEDGIFEVPDGRAEQFVASWPTAEGYDLSDLRVDSEDAADSEDESDADGICGYYDPETMDSPCSRDAGWGRDADDGPCKDHVDGGD